MNSISILDAVPKDAEAIREVSRLGWLATYPNDEHGITREDIDERFAFKTEKDRQKLIEDRKQKIADPLWRYWVAKDGEEVIGFSIARRGEKSNIVEAIYLLPDYQGKGLGEQLTQTALVWLGKEKDIEVNVAKYNDRAIKFYEKFGFRKTGIEPLSEITKLPSGKRIPQIEMVLKY